MTSIQHERATLTKALTASLAIHLAVICVIYNYTGNSPSTRAVSQSSIDVSFTRMNPQDRLSAAQEALLPREADNPENNKAQDTEPVSDETTAVVKSGLPSPGPSLPQDNVDPSLSESGSASVATTQALSSTKLDQSVTDYVMNFKSGLTRQWVEDCQRYRNRSGERDCDENDSQSYATHQQEREQISGLFTDYSSGDYNRRFVRRYDKENTFLTSLTEQDSIVGALARTRRDLNLLKIQYLQREFSTGPVGATRVCMPGPCVFRYSEFEAKKPENRQEEAESFVKRPALFE